MLARYFHLQGQGVFADSTCTELMRWDVLAVQKCILGQLDIVLTSVL